MKYSESEISSEILKGLGEMGFVDMTPIQEQAIPVMMKGRDVVGQAQTGTGKTAAFGIPMIDAINPSDEGVQGLVLCPTRELAIQGATEIKRMSKYVKGVKVAAIYGGQDINRQFRELRNNVSIVIGTPGRVMDHMRRGTLKFDHLKILVLDEADEMLDMGFREDIETICKAMPENRQTALFSATMPQEILEITEQYQKDAEHIEVEHEELTIPSIKQSYYMVKGNQKDTAMCRLIDYMSPKRALIFCNTKRKVDQLTLQLKKKGYSAEALHGDLSQHQRDRVMSMFRNGNLELLLATDVAARGIDVDDVDIVFNYDLPQEMEYYVHRIGRTGRAGKKGKAVSLINTRERSKINRLEKFCNTKIKEKDMPTADDAMAVKAYSNVSRAVDYCEGMDLKPYMEIVYKRCIDDGLEPLEVAASFLRESLGEISTEVVSEKQPRGGKDHKKTERHSSDKDKARRRKEKSKKKSYGPAGNGGNDYYRGKKNSGRNSKSSGKSKGYRGGKPRAKKD